MTTPPHDPAYALIASVSTESLRAISNPAKKTFSRGVVIYGSGAYHAIASYELGGAHGRREISVARKLSRACESPVYVVSFGEDEERVTTCRAGAVVEDVEVEDAGNPKGFVVDLGLGGMFPPELPGVPSFMFIQHTTTEAVEEAIAPVVRFRRSILGLEQRGAHVLGWLVNETLGSLPQAASAAMGARVFHTLDCDQSFAVFVTENGVDVGLFEAPRTSFSDGETPIDSILGETTREGILRAIGALE